MPEKKPGRLRKCVKINCTDAGNAQRFADQHRLNAKYCWSWSSWLVWNGSRWAHDVSGAAERLAKETAASISREAKKSRDSTEREKVNEWALVSESAARLAAMLKIARSDLLFAVEPSDLDTHLLLLNCPNGTLDLRDGRLHPHERSQLLTCLCPTPYDAGATCPKWLAFLGRVLPRPDLIAYIQRLCGYLLTGDVSEHVLPVFYGLGANGKSTLLETLLAVLGPDYSMAAPDGILMLRRPDSHPTAIADLCGKRLVVVSENAQGDQINEPLV
jgi:putative DNA primase/helicase